MREERTPAASSRVDVGAPLAGARGCVPPSFHHPGRGQAPPLHQQMMSR